MILIIKRADVPKCISGFFISRKDKTGMGEYTLLLVNHSECEIVIQLKKPIKQILNTIISFAEEFELGIKL